MTVKTLTLLDAEDQELAKCDVDPKAAALVLLDDKGQQLRKHDLADLAAPAATEKTTVPSTLEWYLDATKWMVSAAAAALVLGLGYFGETTNLILRSVFSVAGGILVAALVAGGLCYLWVLEYARTWDNHANVINDPKKLDKNLSDLDTYASRAGRSYNWLLGTFFAGLLGLSVCCGARMWLAKAKPTYAVTAIGQQVFLTDTSSGETFVLVTDLKTGRGSWKLTVGKKR